MQANWGDLLAPSGNQSAWADLDPAQQQSATALRIDEYHWDSVRATTRAITGCFWHYGMSSAVLLAYAENTPDASQTVAQTRRRQRRDEHARRRRRNEQVYTDSNYGVCAPGQVSNASGHCSTCAPGHFKSADMPAARFCAKKREACAGASQKLLTAASMHGTESAVADDTVCAETSPKSCPAGTFVVHAVINADANVTNEDSEYSCAECPAGRYNSHWTGDTACVEKTKVECSGGTYLLPGTSPSHDDNQCVACPEGTYNSAAGAAGGVRCQAKQRPPTCQSGTSLSLGASASKEDYTCRPCAAGSYSAAAGLGACAQKALTTCGKGTYFYTEGSLTRDDNECVPCPTGTFSGTASSSAVCNAKYPMHCTGVRTYLHVGLSATENDNTCVPFAQCAAGHFVTTPSAREPACTGCPSGHFLAYATNRTSCDKKIAACTAGAQAAYGTALNRDDAQCEPCPARTFNENENARCQIKNPHVAKCPPGTHVSAYTSRVMDDSNCVPCPTGEFMGESNTGAACIKKIAPIVCLAGEHFSRGGSATADDWVCAACAADGYSAQPNVLAECNRKTSLADCDAEKERLRESKAATSDNECYEPGRCSPGAQVAPDGEACEACAVGRFNPEYTTSQAACTSKQQPASCAAGQRLSLGDSATRDDWRCVRCPYGAYQGAEQLVVWTTDVDSGVPILANEQPVRCQPKPELNCNQPGTIFERSDSVLENDWVCAPRPQTVVLCSRTIKTKTRSSIAFADAAPPIKVSEGEGLLVGLPAITFPYTRWYSARLRTRGHAWSQSRTNVVITGARYVPAQRRPCVGPCGDALR